MVRVFLVVVLPVCLSCGCGKSDSNEYSAWSDLQTSDNGRPERDESESTTPDPQPGSETTEPMGEPASGDTSDTPVGSSQATRGLETPETQVTDQEAAVSPDVASGESVSQSSAAGPDVSAVPVSATESRQSGTTPQESAAGDGSLTAEESQQGIRLLIPYRHFRKQDGALRVSFDDLDLLKTLNMNPVPTDAAEYFPDWLKQLDGARVRIRGFMRPGFEAEDLTQFLFVRDNGACCYGPRPAIYDMIAVELQDGELTDWIRDIPFDVEGTFRIEPFVDETDLMGLYFIDDGTIIR